MGRAKILITEITVEAIVKEAKLETVSKESILKIKDGYSGTEKHYEERE
jgi:hypothetical protein